MATTRRFLFETSFDDGGFRPFEAAPIPELPMKPQPEPEPAPEPQPPPEPTFGKADLLQAHEDGYADGFAAGKAAAETTIANRTAASLTALAACLMRLIGPLETEAEDRRAIATDIGLAIARKLLPHAARRHALSEVEGLITAAVAEMIDESRLVIRVADTMMEEIGERVEALTTARGFSGRVLLLADPALAHGDCRVEWAEGGIEHSSERIWNDVDRAEAQLAPVTPEGQEAPPPRRIPDDAMARLEAMAVPG